MRFFSARDQRRRSRTDVITSTCTLVIGLLVLWLPAHHHLVKAALTGSVCRIQGRVSGSGVPGPSEAARDARPYRAVASTRLRGCESMIRRQGWVAAPT